MVEPPAPCTSVDVADYLNCFFGVMKWLQSGSYFGRACTTAITEASRMALSCHGSCTQSVKPSVVLALVAWKSLCFYPPLGERGLKVSMEHVVFWDNSVEIRDLKSGIGKLLASSFVLLTLWIVPTLQVWFALFVSECMSQIRQMLCCRQPRINALQQLRAVLSWGQD